MDKETDIDKIADQLISSGRIFGFLTKLRSGHDMLLFSFSYLGNNDRSVPLNRAIDSGCSLHDWEEFHKRRQDAYKNFKKAAPGLNVFGLASVAQNSWTL